MFRLDPAIKRDPQRRWALPDRIFFGHGACHILAGVYLLDPPLPGFWAERIAPADGFPGNHIYVTDGQVAFDHRGYLGRERLLLHHIRYWAPVCGDGWQAQVAPVDFDLLDTAALSAIKYRGPDQYHGDVIARARTRIANLAHHTRVARVYLALGAAETRAGATRAPVTLTPIGIIR